jgi:uncharacterized protein (DUF1330 family)
MTVYAVVLLNVTEREGMEHYAKGFMEVFNRFDGQILARDIAPTVLEGDWPHSVSVLMSFPSAEALELWYHSPEYQALAQHRFNASTARFAVLRGLG